MKASALAIVVGREGSRGLPGKNVAPIAGRPMIGHTLEHALAARTVARVVVSTDGDAIAAVADSMHVKVVRRPAELATDTTPVCAAVRHAVTTLGTHEPIIVILYANVPVRPAGLIDRAVRELTATGADSVQSYAGVGKHHPHWMVTLDDTGCVQPCVSDAPDRRQDLPRLLIPDGGVIAVTRQALLTPTDDDHPHAFLGRDRRGIETEPGAVIDVDTAADLRLAELTLSVPQEAAPWS